jgi:hypothetical protein
MYNVLELKVKRYTSVEMEFIKKPRSIAIVHVNTKNPFRMQIPAMVSTMKNQYGYIELTMNDEFIDMWTPIEEDIKKHADPEYPWNSPIRESKFRIKLDEKSMVFDSHAKLIIDEPDFDSCMVKCIIELKSIYTFKDMCGITMRIHQVKILEKVVPESTCLL